MDQLFNYLAGNGKLRYILTNLTIQTDIIILKNLEIQN